jgi:hypothetical protein
MRREELNLTSLPLSSSFGEPVAPAAENDRPRWLPREASRIRRVRLDTVPMIVEHERTVTGLEVLRLPHEFLGS